MHRGKRRVRAFNYVICNAIGTLMKSQISTARTSRLWLKLGSVVIVVAIIAFGYFRLQSGKLAPDVTFVNLQGEQLPLKDMRGKVVIVNFWATSCTTCVGEMPQMISTYNQYKDQGLDFVAVAMSYDPPDYVKNYTHTQKLPFDVALDSQSTLANAFGDVQMTPTTFVIDKNGKILKRYLGEPKFDELHALLKQALAA